MFDNDYIVYKQLSVYTFFDHFTNVDHDERTSSQVSPGAAPSLSNDVAFGSVCDVAGGGERDVSR